MSQYYDDSFEYDDDDFEGDVDGDENYGAFEHFVDGLEDIDDLGPEISCDEMHPKVVQNLFNMGDTDLLYQEITPFVERFCACLSTEMIGVLAGDIQVIYPAVGEMKIKNVRSENKEEFVDFFGTAFYIVALAAVFNYKRLRDEYGE